MDNNNVNQMLSQARAAVRAVVRRKWTVVAVAWVVALLGGVIVWLAPNRFEATARIYVDTQSVLKPLMAGLAFQPDTDQQLKMLARTLISRPNIERLTQAPAVGYHTLTGREREEMIDRLIKTIKVDHSGGNLYQISFKDPSPARAKAVVSSLVEIFMTNGSGTKQRDSQEASKFIDEQIREYEVKLAESENRVKDFKLRNFGVTGVSNQDYFSRISALSDDIGRLRVALIAAEQSRDALRRELSSEDPQLPAQAGPAPAPVMQTSELDARLEAQQRALDDLLRRFTDQHPDVLAVRRSISQLEATKSELEARRAAGERPARGNAATNPVFQRIRIALAEAEANVASLKSQLAAQQTRLEEARATATRVPQAEAELAQLNRDYDIIRRNYEQLVSRREAAALGVKIDLSTQLGEFRIIEPPRVPMDPVFPDKRALTALVMLLALAAGVVVAFAQHRAAPVFEGLDELARLTGRHVIGAVSSFVTPAQAAARRGDRLRYGVAMGGFLLANVAWVLLVTRLSASSSL